MSEELYGYYDDFGGEGKNITRKEVDDLMELKLDLLLGEIHITVWRMQ